MRVPLLCGGRSLLARAALPYLREVHGLIVNLSSSFGHRPLPGGFHYAASKGAIEMLTRTRGERLGAARRLPPKVGRWIMLERSRFHAAGVERRRAKPQNPCNPKT